jgi:hypothetical protein
MEKVKKPNTKNHTVFQQKTHPANENKIHFFACFISCVCVCLCDFAHKAAQGRVVRCTPQQCARSIKNPEPMALGYVRI